MYKTNYRLVNQNFFPLMNHVMIPQIYLVTLWRGQTPRLGPTGLKQLYLERLQQ